MLLTIIKNNLKLMLRSKINIALVLIGPIITIAALSNAFSSMMASYSVSDSINVGYNANESDYVNLALYFSQINEEGSMTFCEYPSKDPDKVLRSNDVDVYVIFSGNDYTVYEDSKHQAEALSVEYSLGTIFSSIKNSAIKDSTNIPITLDEINTGKTPTADSTDYYGIIEIVYFMWCGIISLAAVISSENKNKIQNKYIMSSTPKHIIYLSKALPCIIATLLETSISISITSLLFNIHWGNLPLSFLIITLGSFALTSFGLFTFFLFKKSIIAIIFVFSAVWYAGFVGGTFESYMYSSYPESIQKLSPLYHMNRTLVEYSTLGSSSSTGNAIVYLIGFTILFFLLGIILMNKKAEVK